MVTTEGRGRRYRAPCPNCGAPVEFRSAASPFAVCSFCRTTVVRDGDALRRIGQSAELFDDHSPLRLGASGTYQGTPFTLVGRLQYRHADGTWNEWHALFESDPERPRSGWLSEDNGNHVVAFDAPLQGPVPTPEQLVPGAPLTVQGQRWSVASVVSARLIAAEGELPIRPPLAEAFAIVDLRSTGGEVGTLDYADPAEPSWSVGRQVALSELALTGLKDVAEKTLAGRAFACPNCGAPVEVRLTTTQSIVCGQCRSVIDVAGGVGGELAHYAQSRGRAPQIPLGTVGALTLGRGLLLRWQVVGYVERRELPQDDDDDATSWREYLLHHAEAGFAFLVDTDDGWSWVKPLTGAPMITADGARHDGVPYRKLYDYVGVVTHVLGEFYWPLRRDQRTVNTDYQGTGSASAKRLNREQTEGDDAREVVWSAGETLSSDAVVAAFRLPPRQSAALQRDATPTTFNRSSLLARLFLGGFIAAVVLVLFRCDGGGGGAADCTDTRNTFGEASQEYRNCLQSRSSGGGYRTGGGAFGGYSSGGGHK